MQRSLLPALSNLFLPSVFSLLRSRRRLILSHELQIEMTGGSVPSRGGGGGRHRGRRRRRPATVNVQSVFVSFRLSGRGSGRLEGETSPVGWNH